MSPAPSASIASDLIPRLGLLRAMAVSGHLSAAADSIGVPQSTATRWLSGLTDTVGVRLTRRVGRRVELTPAGTALAEAAAEAHTALVEGVVRAQDAADPRRGRITFGFLRTLGSGRAPELLRGFRAVYPHVRFSLVQASHEELVAKLHDGAVDIALASVRATDVDIAAHELFREPFVLVVPSDHRLTRREWVRLPDCRDEPMTGLTAGIALRRRVDEMFAAAGIRLRYRFETDEVETVRGLAAAGAGVAVLPARHGGALPGSREVPIVPRTHRHIGLLLSTRHPVQPTTEGFRRWAIEGR